MTVSSLKTPGERLAALGLSLPAAAAPVANYVPYVRTGDLLFVSGQLPVGSNGVDPAHKGKLGAAVFRAVTRDPHQSIDWHLAGRYLGRTRAPHQMAIQAPSGHYELVLTASDGQRLTRQLHVVRAEFANASAAAN